MSRKTANASPLVAGGTHVAINTLRMVTHPFSNQEGEWFATSKEFREFVRHSKLYMIGQREELRFQNFVGDPSGTFVKFDILGPEVQFKDVRLPVEQFFKRLGDHLDIYKGDKIIKFRAHGREQEEWFTVEKLLYQHYRGEIELKISGDFKKALTFDLLYVGISKKEDSLTRLFDRGHKARTKILSNETQKSPTARLTDELFIMMFDVVDLQIKVIDPDSDEPFTTPPLDKQRLVADAEKAFVHILETRYNVEGYENYPTCLDGLGGTGLSRYSYAIAESIVLKVGQKSFVGSYDAREKWIKMGEVDIIAVSGDEAILIKADGDAD